MESMETIFSKFLDAKATYERLRDEIIDKVREVLIFENVYTGTKHVVPNYSDYECVSIELEDEILNLTFNELFDCNTLDISIQLSKLLNDNWREKAAEEYEEKVSKYMSYLLRHKPEDAGLTLGVDGWVETDELIRGINSHSEFNVDINIISSIVAKDSKQRYSFKDGEKYIRANQGHSVKNLEISFKLVEHPPKYLYHGTSEMNLTKILKSGKILPMSRQMIHLSKDVATATDVGKRHGTPKILRIDTEAAMQDGVKFYISDNKVYLTKCIDIKYTDIM